VDTIGATRSLMGNGSNNSTENQRTGHTAESGPKVKNRNTGQNCRVGEVQMKDRQEGEEKDPPADDRRSYKKNSSTDLFCMLR